MKIKDIKIKNILGLVLCIMALNFSLPSYSEDTSLAIKAQTQLDPSKVPSFNNPVVLLVGLSESELSYREVSSLAGFDFFSVPYRSDLKALTSQVNPAQVIIKHPSGFVGLYSPEGQLIRGIDTTMGPEVSVNAGNVPPSIIQPTEANPIFENLYYPGAVTGSVAHGGLGYTPPPRGRTFGRFLLKLATFTGLTPFQYPGYFQHFATIEQRQIFPNLLLPNVPIAIGAAAQYADAKFDQAEYQDARTQPRDYMFQPVIEGY
ncbi:MAG: hypothetical protein A3B68_04110 [Candidatus Melainabacteria bacterium RIFCSPHIGHO2_02_FULL_34_12]|nr:MAG: hypothetical protein A3B68_04110 [Candidatus Melainabacteria bacterium RIFCSPHIGHO2_02_FULL_34_12]